MPQFPQRAVVFGALLGRGAEDDVVEDVDFQELAGADQIAGDFHIGFAWSRIAAGMIVNKNDGRGIRGDGGLEYFARVNQNGVQRAIGNFINTNQAAARVEQKHLEFFGVFDAIGFAEKADDGSRIVQHRRFLASLGFHTARERKGGDERGSFVRTDARLLFQIID